jgi:hypothetical protein
LFTQGAFVFYEIRFQALDRRAPDRFSALLANAMVVMEQQVGYKTGNKPGSRFQNSLKSLCHQEKDTPS